MIRRRTFLGGLGAAALASRANAYFVPPPNDPLYSNQWHLPIIHWAEAVALTQGSTGTVIADFGTGNSLTTDNPPNQITGYNELLGNTVTADMNLAPYGTDTIGHNSQVTSIMMGATNEGAGTAGVCPNATLATYVISCDGGGPSGSVCFGYTDATVADAVNRAVTAGAHILNMPVTFTFNFVSGLTAQAIHKARSQGIVVVCAAGDTSSCVTTGVPQKVEGVISVGWTTISDVAAPLSPTCDVTLMAPGGDNTGTAMYDMGANANVATNRVGSSLSCPIVSGICALMRTANPKYSALRGDEIEYILMSKGCDAIQGIAGYPTLDTRYGYGRVNAYKAVLAAQAYSRPVSMFRALGG